MDRIIVIVVILSTIQMFAEILVHKMYLNVGVNLERRTSLKSQTRLDDLVRVAIVASLVGSVSFLLGRFAFSD